MGTNPAQPVVFSASGSLPGTSQSYAVQVVNDLVYAAGLFTGQFQSPTMTLYVYDVRDLHEPIPVGNYTNAGTARTVWVDGNRVYLAGEDTPLQIIETPFDTRPVAPPQLALSAHDGLKLQLHGRRGLHYDLEYADGLEGFPWQPLPTFLLTNETAVFELPVAYGTRFFRVRQVD